ncbi:aldo/keto reductase [Streptomyces sp. NBC_01764]|uniref:aldo/keto reductase n=1 Tax=Streptomyces sp. NBC_01764 TaxID=2975935 RepID=UPI00224CFCBB|nr:aldo/keto reductase [Streptomyces sp. NBC_01764]MCX4411609.1 aldo/keto reductase [Streptomyces sp. NBC_01764]
MTAQLTLGTYRCRNIPEAAARAVASGAEWIDTAPNYGTGRAQSQLAPTLTAHPSVHVSTKVGYFTAATGGAAVNDGVLTPEEATTGHSLTPEYVRWQVRRNCLELRRERLDVVLLHNPERAHPGDRSALYRTIRDAFTVLEEEVAAGRVGGYGVATWHGFEQGAFSVPLVLALAAEAAGGQHHLTAVQLPVSLVMMSPIQQVLDGHGPIRAAATAGLRVMASAPLHGGELLDMVDRELVDLIRPGLTPAQACILAAASCPGVTQVLVAASSAPHWKEAADAVAQPPLDIARLREITGVLASV